MFIRVEIKTESLYGIPSGPGADFFGGNHLIKFTSIAFATVYRQVPSERTAKRTRDNGAVLFTVDTCLKDVTPTST